MGLPSLSDLFWAHLGPVADKWEQYIPFYEAELRRYLESQRPVVLLEIGVMNGGSLELWRKLLPPQSRVVGMDIDERCRVLQLSDGIELHIGDATQRTFVDTALGETRFDIIIDDGSHRSIDIIATFENLFGRLKPGGSYIVEDLHTSYWREYGGGFRTEGSSIEWAKNLVDAINADHIKNTADIPSEEVAQLKEFNKEIARIAFFDSALVVQKYLAPKNRSFARVVTGTEFPVFDPIQWVHSMPVDSLGNLIVGPSVARRLETGLTRSLEEKEHHLNRQKQELQGKEQEVKRQAQQLQRQAQQLKSLLTSTSWKITSPLRWVGEALRSLRRSGRSI
jgi:hypothetical protein